ncbi:hypothetical protein R3P38DRAFT_2825200 [Favolaschia claudopus]|uniref:NAD(P)-binding domain-containing protein n=1 Tax=Favolaschia claudopus TaxID=2862362 RepID=A0AAW0EJ47_9AGAR
MKFLVLGSTGPSGILLVRETLSAYTDSTIILYVRSPGKIPDDLKGNANCTVVEGQLDDKEALSKAMEGVDIVLSALGPAQFTHPSGTPLAHSYANIIKVMKSHNVNRLLALGTASIEDPSDKFSILYYSMIKTVSISMRNAYKDIIAIGQVIRSSNLEHWTIIRVPALGNNTSKELVAGYIGDDKIKNRFTLNRIGFASFVVEEIGTKQWDLKAPLLVSI